MPNIFSGLFDSNDKEIKRLQRYVDAVNELEEEYKKLTDEELKAKTAEFKAKIAEKSRSIQPKLEEAKQELTKAKQQADAVLDFGQSDAAREVKRIEEKIKQLEKDSQKLEQDALDEILPEAFAAVREAARRTLGQRHYDVQLLGGVNLHQGKIAEMLTGEGKTLVATLPLYLNALTGRGVHLVTVNDYLARRDPYWMGPVYHALGVTVASIYPMQTPDERTPALLYDPTYDSGKEKDIWRHFRPISRKEAYQADITYGTTAEFGFDYLRDNMVVDLSQRVQRPLYFAIVDEVDNLLIDEARTPLIISGPAEDTGDLYKSVNDVVARMNKKVLPYESKTRNFAEQEEMEKFRQEFDYIAYEKDHYAEATASGQEKLARAFHMRVEDIFGGETADEGSNMSFDEAKKIHDIQSIFRQSLIAHSLFHKDRQYVIEDNGEIVIVDEFTGRKMYGRRYSDGLHQAIEAKERVKVQRESMTYATITIQNYFRMYEKLAGMTGTAATEAEEFDRIYKLDVTQIPTNLDMIRDDSPDLIYKSEPGKYKAIVQEIKSLHDREIPVLIGTVSIDKSVQLSDMLKRQGINCQVLNAKEHTREGEIVANAGRPGMVTVATNMAGRGVDIVLGGRKPEKPETDDPEAMKQYEKDLAEWQKQHDKVIETGGLHIIGTERHEARRIDNQLRGRAGRQGDPGQSRFFISLEDDIMRRFGGDRMKTVLGWVGMSEDTPIENKMVTNMITDVQKRVEGYHFDIRKNLVEYDDVVNTHRDVIYKERDKVLSGVDLKSNILEMVSKEISNVVAAHPRGEYGGEADIGGIIKDVSLIMPLPRDLDVDALAASSERDIEQAFIDIAVKLYEDREQQLGPEKSRLLERLVMLQIIDRLWVEHLTDMERMRLQAGWQTLRQIKSVDAYKSTGYAQFQTLLENIQHEIAYVIFHVGLTDRPAQRAPVSPMAQANMGSTGDKKPVSSGKKKVGRNDPCPCGSGKKYKHCCGK
ncbi:MAG: preprotein translocase subunit SecA [Dehalococcoidales bacterium]|nr:preprotein translocase subunit SecA [Dehalococcoidales bacterium]